MAFPAAEYQQRLTTFQKQLTANSAVLIAKPSHIHYLIGLQFLVANEREALLFVSPKNVTVIGSSFLPPLPLKDIQVVSGLSAKAIASQLKNLLAKVAPAVTHLQLDEQALFANEYLAILTATKDVPKLEISAFDERTLWRQRQRKSAAELKLIKKAAKLAINIFEDVTSGIQAGMTELDLRQQFDLAMLKHGAQPAFPTIVAFGAHGAAPHHQPTDTPLKTEDAVLIDWGCQIDGYCSDFTRSFWFGALPNEKWLKVQLAVHQAYDAAFYAIQVGQPVADIDRAARQTLKDAGYGKNYIHTTGHSLGLEVHEPPSVYETTDGLVEAGMVLTIEPGVYLDGQFGYRHENTIAISQKEVLPLG